MFSRLRLGRSACVLGGLLSLTTLTGCGGGGGVQPATFAGPDPMALSMSATTPSDLTASLTQDKATTSTGAPLGYTLTLSNPTSQAVSVQAFGGFNAQGQYDLSKMQPVAYLQIADASGKTIYPDPTAVQPQLVMASVSVTLPPGQAISEKVSIPGGLSPSGRYQASATFLASGSGMAGEVDTSVGPLTVSVH